MAQINLLKQKKPSANGFQIISGLVVKLLVVAFAGLLVYYGYLFFRTKQEIKAATSLEQKIENKRKELAKKPERPELFTRQQQIKELQTLLAAHPYWSTLLPALAKSSLKNLRVVDFRALADGTLSMSVSVPTIEDLDKFLQVFDLPQFNENFFDVRIGSIGRTQQDKDTTVTFDVRMKYNSKLLDYSSTKGQ